MSIRHSLIRSGIATLILAAFSSASSLNAEGVTPRNLQQDRQTLIALEKERLENERNRVALEHILAPDFVHAVVSGDFLTKTEHISWSTKHPPPAK